MALRWFVSVVLDDNGDFWAVAKIDRVRAGA